jgi:hypothetical protein
MSSFNAAVQPILGDHQLNGRAASHASIVEMVASTTHKPLPPRVRFHAGPHTGPTTMYLGPQKEP